jgi:hypothetical protein
MSVSTADVIDPAARPAPAAAPVPQQIAVRMARQQQVAAPVPQQIAVRMARQQQVWRPLVRFGEPRFATRLASGAGWEAWLLSWLPGQSTQLHDHGGSAGAFMVVAGQLDETVAVSPVVPAREPPRWELVTQRHGTGEIRAFGPQHVHDVACRTDQRAVSLHVYAPGLSRMTRYVLDDSGPLRVISRERAGADW